MTDPASRAGARGEPVAQRGQGVLPVAQEPLLPQERDQGRRRHCRRSRRPGDRHPGATRRHRLRSGAVSADLTDGRAAAGVQAQERRDRRRGGRGRGSGGEERPAVSARSTLSPSERRWGGGGGYPTMVWPTWQRRLANMGARLKANMGARLKAWIRMAWHALSKSAAALCGVGQVQGRQAGSQRPRKLPGAQRGGGGAKSVAFVYAIAAFVGDKPRPHAA